MLSVLSFKKSLFAGVLDGGESSVFLGGSRLARFMDTVKRTTTAIAGPVIADQGAAVDGDEPGSSAAKPADPRAALVQTGVTLSNSSPPRLGRPRRSPTHGSRIVQRDRRTGQDYLRIPMPSAEVLERAMKALGEMLGRFTR